MTHLSKLIWALVGGVIAVLGSLAVFYLTTKSPDLVYEAFPPSHVATTSADVSIYNVRLDNRGNKEATEIQVYLGLPNGSFIDDIQVTPTLVAIPHSKERQTDSAFLIHLPSLNAGEGAQFSLLAQRANSAPLKVEVRARDAPGRGRQSDERTSTSRYVTWAVSTASIIVGALLAIGGAVLVRDSRIFFQRMFARQLQTLRTQPSPPADSQQSEAQLTTLLLGATFRFFFSPSVSLDKSKIMRFGANGTILEGNNKKEASWRIRNGLFEFLTAKSQVNSRFYYSPGDRVFYQIPDQDTSAVALDGIGDQYMMAVATQSA